MTRPTFAFAALLLLTIPRLASAAGLKLDGVVHDDDPGKSVAIINGELLQQGETYENNAVEEIGRDYVILRPLAGGKNIRLPLWMGATGSAPAAPASTGTQVGVAGAASGNVRVARGESGVGEIVQTGEPIRLGDVIKTGAEGSLQIRLADDTTFTIGPNSAIVIDEFVYDPASQDGHIGARVVEGFFRFVTGKIAHKNPQSMTVDLPTGNIGVRGTRVEGHIDFDESGLVVLRSAGSILVSGKSGGEGVLISQPDYGTRVARGRPPVPAFPVAQAELDTLQQHLDMPSAAAVTAEAAEAEPLPPRPSEGLTESQKMGEQIAATAHESGASFGGLNPFAVLNMANETKAMAEIRQIFTACAVSMSEEQYDSQGNFMRPTLTIQSLKERRMLPRAFAEKTAYYTYSIQMSPSGDMDFEVHAIPFSPSAGLRYLMVDGDGIMHAEHGRPATIDSPQP